MNRYQKFLRTFCVSVCLSIFLIACDSQTDRDPLIEVENEAKNVGEYSGKGPGLASREDQIIPPGIGWHPSVKFDLAEPGSYDLPAVGAATDGEVLRASGDAAKLSDFMGDRYAVMSFIFSTCGDLNGCPLATAVFFKLKERLAEDPRTANKVRLISLSFDPEYDTPEIMNLYGKGLGGGNIEWEFLTTQSEEKLQPIIDGFGQMVVKEYDEGGEYTGNYAHILRVFLIDKKLNIRQEYNVSFLHDDIIFNDLLTLIMQDESLVSER